MVSCFKQRNMTDNYTGEPQYWLKKWKRGNTDWHLTCVNPWLLKNIQLLTCGQEHIKIFIPLCGKSVDIKWLADIGHDVVGVDVSSQGFQQFFLENNLEYNVFPVPKCNGSVYKGTDGNIRLYCCNIFDFTNTIEGTFDAVWDRAAMVALPAELMEKYHACMLSLMSPNCQYILEKFDYENPQNQAAPHLVSLETLQRNFGSSYKVDVLETFPSQYFKEKFGCSYLNVEIVRISRKV